MKQKRASGLFFLPSVSPPPPLSRRIQLIIGGLYL